MVQVRPLFVLHKGSWKKNFLRKFMCFNQTIHRNKVIIYRWILQRESKLSLFCYYWYQFLFSPAVVLQAVHTDILFIQKKMNFARLLQNKGYNPMVSVLTLITDGLSQKTGFYLCEPSSGTELLHRVCIWILWQLNWETVNWVLH